LDQEELDVEKLVDDPELGVSELDGGLPDDFIALVKDLNCVNHTRFLTKSSPRPTATILMYPGEARKVMMMMMRTGKILKQKKAKARKSSGVKLAMVLA